ncbi:hypothetical protein PFISCL1PPCAC_12746, partial [Pristionchus fissidentatus]
FRTVFLFAIVGLLLISSLDAAKQQKSGKGKKNKSVESAEKTAKNGKTEKTKKATKPVVGEEVVVVEESVVPGELPIPRIVRPKTLKVISAFDKCNMECKTIIDQQDIHSYVAQLRDELMAVETALNASAQLEEYANAEARAAA